MTSLINTNTHIDQPKMMRSTELSFDVPQFLAKDIDEYIDAYERDDWRHDMYMEILFQSAGSISEHDREWIIEYYMNGGWEDGLEYTDVG